MIIVSSEIVDLIPLSAIEEAQRVIAGKAIRTPLVRLNLPEAPAEIYLKLENLQPIEISERLRRNFKLRHHPMCKILDIREGPHNASL